MTLPVGASAAPIRCALIGAALSLSGAVMAQSSVSLYGTADAGIGRMGYGAPNGSDADKKTQFTSGSLVNNSTSYIGLRGVEDLGGGLRAGFNIESNLGLDNGNVLGAGGGHWGRLARVYLNGSWGTFQLGRTYAPSFLAMISWQLTGSANYSVVGWTYNWGGEPHPGTAARPGCNQCRRGGAVWCDRGCRLWRHRRPLRPQTPAKQASRIGPAVPALDGPSDPCLQCARHPMNIRSGKPTSAVVGTSGRWRDRSLPVNA